MNKSFTDSLADAALRTLSGLNDPSSGIDPDRARAAALVLKEAVNLCKVDVERMKATGSDDSTLFGQSQALPATTVTALPTAHDPFRKTVHRIQG